MKQREGFKIDLGDITKHNVGQLKRLNTVIFPVMYNDKFYKDVLDLGELAQLVYFNDIIVGAVCCRVEKGGPPQNPNSPQATQVTVDFTMSEFVCSILIKRTWEISVNVLRQVSSVDGSWFIKHWQLESRIKLSVLMIISFSSNIVRIWKSY